MQNLGYHGKMCLKYVIKYLIKIDSNKFVNAWGKIISAEILLDEKMFVACMERLYL